MNRTNKKEQCIKPYPFFALHDRIRIRRFLFMLLGGSLGVILGALIAFYFPVGLVWATPSNFLWLICVTIFFCIFLRDRGGDPNSTGDLSGHTLPGASVLLP